MLVGTCIFRIQNRSLSQRTMLASVGIHLKKSKGGQTATRHQFINSLTVGLSSVEKCRLPSCEPLHNHGQWSETLHALLRISHIDEDALTFCILLGLEFL